MRRRTLLHTEGGDEGERKKASGLLLQLNHKFFGGSGEKTQRRSRKQLQSQASPPRVLWTGARTGWPPCIRWITPTWTPMTPAWRLWKRRPTRTSAPAARPAPSSTTRSEAGRSPTRAAPHSARPVAHWEPWGSISPLLTPQVRSVSPHCPKHGGLFVSWGSPSFNQNMKKNENFIWFRFQKKYISIKMIFFKPGCNQPLIYSLFLHFDLWVIAALILIQWILIYNLYVVFLHKMCVYVCKNLILRAKIFVLCFYFFNDEKLK